MRDLRLVTAEQFNAFVSAYSPALQAVPANGVVYYVDNSNGAEWPENLVASYVTVGPNRRRPGAHRIPLES